MIRNWYKSSRSIFAIISALYLIEPSMTILGFTAFKSPLVFQSIILLQMILGIFCITLFSGRSFKRKNVIYLFSFCITIFSAIFYILFAEESAGESLIFSVRIVASLGFFLLGIAQSEILSEDDIWLYFCKIPIIGVILGEATYFTVIFLGYNMTHSISAYAAIPGLVYLLAISKGGILSWLTVFMIILLTGKSTVIVIVFSLLAIVTIRRWWSIHLFVLLLVVSFGFSIDQFDFNLPTKTGIRVTALLKAIARNEVSFELLNNISSSRLYEVEQIWNDWRSSKFRIFFGLGTDTTVIKAKTGAENSTIHMSYVKMLTSFGVFSIPMFFVTMSLLFKSIILISDWSRCNRLQIVVGLSVATGFLIASFQFTLFQNSHLWILSGVFISRVYPKYISQRVSPIFCLAKPKGAFTAK